MKADSGTRSHRSRLSARAGWIPLLAGVAFGAAFLVRNAILVTWPEGQHVLADSCSSDNQFEVAQAEEGAEAPEVPPDQVEKYINAYKAMQQNHTLTVDQAASQQGLSVKQFRDIEGKVERDDMLREHVRQVLSKSSKPGPQ
jgi:hypothetical protein